ncbi:MAG: glycosyltransferase [Bryobacteraceae bacterium]|jgi:glycosyltransferase involved in cell wall biosynthesis/SAM-dependent methyltransferase
MPPSKSGIADYSSALVEEMAKRASVTVFDSAEASPGNSGQNFDPARFDAALYHLGNNPHHDFIYDTALRHPGIVVMHEANLHHLVAHVTIRRGDWDTYVAECAYNGGPEALAFAERVRTLEVGPDYEGLAMTRRLLEASLGVIVHSNFVARETRAQGFEGPLAVIPHGAWIPETNRNATRHMLGLDETTPLIGAFGYIKPYKRIAESLRALRRLVRLDPRVRMILVGEPHPEFPVAQLIRTLGLSGHVRLIGFAPIKQFVEFMGACDIILNLRYPTVGETSGSLQRALGLGKAVIVSDVGAFSELPDDICLKAPVGPEEEDLIFEYLNVLVSRPDLAQALGARAKAWVETECSWSSVAERYVKFMGECVPLPHGRGSETPAPIVETPLPPPIENPVPSRDPASPSGVPAREKAVPVPEPVEPEAIKPEAIEAWVGPESREYATAHKSRLVHTLEITPPGNASKSILEMGAYMQITPALHFQFGYGTVRGCYYGPPGRIDRKSLVSESGEIFTCEVDHFDAEKHVYPYSDESFDTVLCCELIEHLFEDPMHMMSEINRILKPLGHLVLTTPNAGSLRAISGILLGYHPAFFPAYIRPRKEGEEAEARHNREYVPMEIQHLLTDSGFETERLETGEFLDQPHPEFAWVTHLLERYKLSHNLRGDGIYAVGRKTGPVRTRFPSWLYA